MATLRDEGCELVTYERTPYPRLPKSASTSSVTFGEGDDAETLRFTESRTNLKNGRGRVRRIAVLDEEGRQVNLLACSTLPPRASHRHRPRPVAPAECLQARQRALGIHHLDARKVVPVDPNQVIPNPARRRLDIARRAADRYPR
jgi:hypothetical protein